MNLLASRLSHVLGLCQPQVSHGPLTSLICCVKRLKTFNTISWVMEKTWKRRGKTMYKMQDDRKSNHLCKDWQSIISQKMMMYKDGNIEKQQRCPWRDRQKTGPFMCKLSARLNICQIVFVSSCLASPEN